MRVNIVKRGFIMSACRNLPFEESLVDSMLEPHHLHIPHSQTVMTNIANAILGVVFIQLFAWFQHFVRHLLIVPLLEGRIEVLCRSGLVGPYHSAILRGNPHLDLAGLIKYNKRPRLGLSEHFL